MRGGELRRTCLLACLVFHAGIKADDSQDASRRGVKNSTHTFSQTWIQFVAVPFVGPVNELMPLPTPIKEYRGDYQPVESKSANSAVLGDLDDTDERSSAFAQSVANGGSANSLAQATGDASANAQALYQAQGGYPYNQYGSALAQAQAEANAQGGGYPGYPAGSASASAEALANAGGAGYPGQSYPNPGYPNPGYPQSLGGSSASALAEAQANAGSSGYPGSPSAGYPNSGYPNSGYPNSGFPGQSYPSGSSASALAEAQANAGSANYQNPGFPSYPSGGGVSQYPPGGGLNSDFPGYPQGPTGSSALAQAEAEANVGQSGYPGYFPSGGGISQYPPNGYPSVNNPRYPQASPPQASPGGNSYPYYPGSQALGGTASASALAEALANGQLRNEGQSLLSQSGNPKNPDHLASASADPNADRQGVQYPGQEYPYDGASAEAYAEAQAEASGLGLSEAGASASAHAIAGSRLIPSNELTPGNPSIQCAYAGQLHYYWSYQYECSVCACVSEYGVLKPVCASCAGCMRPQPPYPPPTTPLPWPTTTQPYPTPPPPPPPPPPTTPPPPDPPAPSCAPLPTNTPFQNPLNPCQICICTLTLNELGKPDVTIVCRENPQCVLPTTELPPAPFPTPQPLCGRFPPNVWFPHPNDQCKVCKCTIQYNPVTGRPEHLINCIPNPACEPPTTVRPTTQYPIISTTPDPYPWPPTPKPQPSPLPGPKPHESCRPYRPNVPFDHPWDPCQLCVCSEAYKVGFVNVEINCYTKKECCIEPPEPLPPPQPAPQPHPLPGPLPGPVPYPPPYPGIGSSSASAHAVATAQTTGGSYPSYPVPSPGQPTGPSYPVPSPGQPTGPSYPVPSPGQPTGPSYPVPSPGQTGPSYPGYQGSGAGASASAVAGATANSLRPSYVPGYPQGAPPGFPPGLPQGPPGYPQGPPGYPQVGGVSSAYAKAQAEAVANGFVPGYYPGKELYQPGFKSAAEVEAQAEANSNLYGFGGSSAQAQSEAEAVANQYGLGSSSAQAESEAAALAYGSGGSAQAQSQAEANANLYGPRASPYSAADASSQDNSLSPAQAKALAEAAANRQASSLAQAQADSSSNQFRTAVNQFDARQSSPLASQAPADSSSNQFRTAANQFDGRQSSPLASQTPADSSSNQFRTAVNQFEARASPQSAAQSEAEAAVAQLRQSGSLSAAQVTADSNQFGVSAGRQGFQVPVASAGLPGSQFDPFGHDLNNGYETVPVGSGDVALANAEAASQAAAQGRYSGQENNFPLNSVPASSLYPKLYPRPSSHVTPLYVPPGLRDGNLESQVAGADYSSVNAGASQIRTGERCAYDGDKYEYHCQACECRSGPDGAMVAFCSGTPCV